MDRLAAMQSFVRTVERGSFAAAATASNLSPAMVGNHVRFLEARLGVPLLHRNTRRQSITEFGRSYYERCRAILMEVEAAEASADATLADPRGLLRITAPLSLGTTVLPRIVAAYMRRHKEVRVDLILGDQRLDLLTDSLDAAIRVGTLPDSGLIARALPPMRLVVCASPAYLAAHGTPGTAAELATHECLDFFHAEPNLWHLRGPDGDAVVPANGRLRINNGQALRAAALEGAGIIMPPVAVVADDLADGRLVRLLADHAAPSLPLHVLTLPDANAIPKLRSFISMLAAGLGHGIEPEGTSKPRSHA